MTKDKYIEKIIRDIEECLLFDEGDFDVISTAIVKIIKEKKKKICKTIEDLHLNT